jgi:hypothetical protein
MFGALPVVSREPAPGRADKTAPDGEEGTAGETRRRRRETAHGGRGRCKADLVLEARFAGALRGACGAVRFDGRCAASLARLSGAGG